jgi:hypothetical protein
MHLNWALLLSALVLLGCQATPPKFETRRPESVTIQGFPFIKTVAKDTFGSPWKLVELRPAQLPYTGELASLSEGGRWAAIFKDLNVAIQAECKGQGTDGKPKYRADKVRFADSGQAMDTPKFAQAKFKCK